MTHIKHNKALLVSLFITLGLIITIMTDWLLRRQLSLTALSEKSMLIQALTRVGWIGLLLIIALKNSYLTSTSSIGERIKNSITSMAFLIPLVILLLLTTAHADAIESLSLFTLVCYFSYVISVGAVEEITFRGVIFSVLAKRHTYKYTVLLSSLLFGLVHFINIFNTSHNFTTIFGQVVITFGLGMFFCGIRIRTGSLIPGIILHSLFNISFGGDLTRLAGVEEVEKMTSNSIDWTSLLINAIVLFGLCLYGYRTAQEADNKSLGVAQ